MTDKPERLQIDIVSDVVCPWCVVGYRQLAEALTATATAHEIHWHPFELNPQMGPEGQNLGEHIAEKYGSTREQSQQARARLTELGAAVGFPFKFSDGSRIVNTFNAHQMIHWADKSGRGHDLKQALFSAYFSEQRDVSDIAVLVEIAGSVGLDTAEARKVIEDQRFAEAVRQTEGFWTQQGISGVPAVIFDRKHLVSGAQGVENYTKILEQLATMRAPAS
ncbi:putative DsbA family dithiol-disulfide isomerase [Hoeflea marina]|uniref:Putative DsbA family dithiol-disulfide isomerase n=1 Tax=Hoeflea marina TaxID=274592 RepID=A0A317PRA3_9HYPH|nr:DsbA family oxidoreductase [Hoeflea marina]PWW01404.1 putative DsbA family dithiol-disulfide isomerase [Hoeflea marina]